MPPNAKIYIETLIKRVDDPHQPDHIVLPEWGYDTRRRIETEEDVKREYKQNYYIASAQWRDEDEEESKEIRRGDQDERKNRRLEVIIHRL